MQKLWAIFLIFLVAVSVCRAEVSPTVTDPHAEVVNNKINKLMSQFNIPGATVILYVNGKPNAYYYGYTNQEKAYRVTKYTIFEIGSLTKIFTSLLFAQELDYARMQLNDPIQKFIPHLPKNGFSNLTLQQLVTHTAGLPSYVPASITSENDLSHYFSQELPSKQWQDSNVDMGLLGIALENSTDLSLDELYKRHILNPLGMQPIGLMVPPHLQHFMAQGYDSQGNLAPEVNMGLFPGANGLKLSGSDMQKFLGAALALPGTPERILYPMLMTESTYVKLSQGNQGLGWNIYSLNNIQYNAGKQTVVSVLDRGFYTPKVFLENTGTSAGFKTYMAVIPAKKTAIAILVNKAISTQALVKTARDIISSV